MAGMISISSNLDASKFLAGVDDMSAALDAVDNDIKTTAQDGDKEVGKLEKSFADAAKSAQGSGQEMGTSVSRGVRSGVEESAVHFNSFKKSAKEAGVVAAGSLDGTLGGTIDTIKVAATNMFAQLGPGAAAAAAVAGMAFGLIANAVKEDEEKAKAATERINEMGKALIEAGSTSVPLETIADNLKLIVTNADKAPKKFKDITEEAKKTGLSVEGLAMAYAGNEDALKSMAAGADKAFRDEYNSLKKNAAAGAPVWSKKLEDLQATGQELKRIQDETTKAQEIEQAWLNSGGKEMLAKEQSIKNINSAYDEAVYGVQTFLDKESEILDIQKYIDSIERRKTYFKNYQSELAAAGLTTEQKKALEAQGFDTANLILAGIRQGTPAQREYLISALDEAAKDSSGVAMDSMESTFSKPLSATVTATADTTQAQRELDALTKTKTVEIVVDWRDRYGQKVN